MIFEMFLGLPLTLSIIGTAGGSLNIILYQVLYFGGVQLAESWGGARKMAAESAATRELRDGCNDYSG